MLNRIWIIMLAGGFLVAIINNRVEAVTLAVMDSTTSAVQLCIGLIGIMATWTGIMRVAEKAGLLKVISKIVSPVMKLLFPDVPKSHPAMGAMVMNMAANFLGLGNAATPFGISAMNELQKLNENKQTASRSMIMFIVLNTAAIQLVPSTIIAVRAAAGSARPTEIMPSIWFSSICATIAGVFAVKFFSLFNFPSAK